MDLRLVATGIAMVGTSFGLARYGYGLLLPDMRASFHLSNAALGAIATGSYAAYLAGTGCLAAVTGRLPSWQPVAAGGLFAVVGMLLVAIAGSPFVLAVGVLIAGASAAFAYPPFADAVAERIPEQRQGRVLALISSGTGWGVALAVAIALIAASSWRTAWVEFAAVGALSTVAAVIVLRRGRRATTDPDPLPPLSWSWFVCPRSGPLLVGALLVGHRRGLHALQQMRAAEARRLRNTAQRLVQQPALHFR